MTTRDYGDILSQLRNDLAELEEEREDLERRIARLRQTVVMLGGLCEDPEPIEMAKLLRNTSGSKESLTSAVRSALLASNIPLDAPEIRDVLISLGHSFRSSNVLASIYSVLKRLRERGEIDSVRGPKVNEKGGTYEDTAYNHPYNEVLPKGWEVVPFERPKRRKRR